MTYGERVAMPMEEERDTCNVTNLLKEALAGPSPLKLR